MKHFSPEEKFDCYMLTAGVMTCGGIEFKTKGRDDQAECEDISETSFPGLQQACHHRVKDVKCKMQEKQPELSRSLAQR